MLYIGQRNCWNRKMRVFLLAFCWCSGLATGLASAVSAGEPAFSLMRTMPQADVSIVRLLGSQMLPFLISAFAVYIHAHWLILPISFGKAFVFSYCASMLTMAYGTAGWLLRLLLMFSDLCLCPVLLWFWVRHIDADTWLRRTDLAVPVLTVGLTVYLDQTLVAPFLQAVLEF